MKRWLAFLALVACLGGTARAADDSLSAAANQAYLTANAQKHGVVVKPDGLQFRIIQNGFGKRPNPTDTVQVYYTGQLINGTVFDGTSPGLPASFEVQDLIRGWTEALEIMREGDHWQLIIPANLGYGDRGSPDGGIPPNQTLVFDMRLISTTPKPKKGEPGYRPDPHDKDDEQQQ
jgi:FKBP-type peptidyl-prolyl cis-trans isomerase